MIQEILDWTEVWALLIPVVALRYFHKKAVFLKPVIWYLFIALVLNICIDIIVKQRQLHLPLPWHNNSLLYNIHSTIRLLLFSFFFIRLDTKFLLFIRKAIPVFYILFIIVNFYFFESFVEFSSRLLTVEVTLLLLYCLLFYWNFLAQDHQSSYTKMPQFWVVTGLSIYVVICFPIFLFYNVLSVKFENFAISLWSVHNIAYLIFCCFIAKSFYESKHY